MIDLSTWDSEAEYLILDDIEWEYLPNKKPLLFCQKEFVLTDKYRKKKTVKWGKPSIYICNPDMNKYHTLSKDFQDNIFYYEINDPLN